MKGVTIMKKNEQIEINRYVENIALDIFALMRTNDTPIKWSRLYHCNADYTILKGGWFVLRSYSTIVAAYNVYTDEMFDFLRLVYGYTPTSAQHIAKFRKFLRIANGYNTSLYRWQAV